jgi:hypothetical protein
VIDKDIKLSALQLVMANLSRDGDAFNGTLDEVGEAPGRLLAVIQQLAAMATLGYARMMACECEYDPFDEEMYGDKEEYVEAVHGLCATAAILPQVEIAKLLGMYDKEIEKMNRSWVVYQTMPEYWHDKYDDYIDGTETP